MLLEETIKNMDSIIGSKVEQPQEDGTYCVQLLPNGHYKVVTPSGKVLEMDPYIVGPYKWNITRV